LASAAARRFGTWSKALLAAGIPGVKEHRLPRHWNKQAIVEVIHGWLDAGMKVTEIRRADTGLAAAARKHFGSWHAAMRAAGVEAN
jgi:hypothetical protein